jgi:hypothetical protein
MRRVTCGRRLFFPCAALAAFLGACAGPREKPPLWPSALEIAPMSVEVSAVLAKTVFIPQYELFQDSGAPWGEGSALGPLWRHDLENGGLLSGLAIGADGAVLVAESRPDVFSQSVLRRLDASGGEVSSATISSPLDRLTAGDFGGHPALLAQADYGLNVLAADGTPVWHPGGTMQKALFADLKGDGKKALVAAMPDFEGVLGAYSAKGRKLWTRKGFDQIDGLAAGRFGRDRAESIVVFANVKGVSVVSVLDADGRTTRSFSDDSVPERGAVLRTDGAATRLVHVGNKFQSAHTRLRISRLVGSSRTVDADADVGRAQPSSLVLVDLKGDGRKEIALGMDNGWVLIYDSDGGFLAEKHFFGDVRFLAAADLDKDGGEELLIGVRAISSEVYAYGITARQAMKAK